MIRPRLLHYRPRGRHLFGGGVLVLVLAARLPAQAPPADGSPRAAVLFNLALEARRSGDTAIAAIWLEQAVTLDPHAALPRLEWASVLLERGDPSAVAIVLDPLEERIGKAAADDPPQAAAYYRLRAAAASRAGNPEAAVGLYERAARYAPADLGLRAQLIGLHRARGSTAAALVHLMAAADLMPRNIDLRLEVGRALLELERWRDAEDAFRDALQTGSGHGDAWDGLGLALAGQENYGAAEEAFRAGLRVAPASARLYEHLGDALTEGGRIADALTAYQRAVALAPDNEARLEEKIERARAAIPR